VGEGRLEARGEEGNEAIVEDEIGEREIENRPGLRREIPVQQDEQVPEDRKAPASDEQNDHRPAQVESAQGDEDQAVERAGEPLDVLTAIVNEALLQEEEVVDVPEVDEGIVHHPSVVDDEEEPPDEIEPLEGRGPGQHPDPRP
jgi:hypothetical protein